MGHVQGGVELFKECGCVLHPNLEVAVQPGGKLIKAALVFEKAVSLAVGSSPPRVLMQSYPPERKIA